MIWQGRRLDNWEEIIDALLHLRGPEEASLFIERYRAVCPLHAESNLYHICKELDPATGDRLCDYFRWPRPWRGKPTKDKTGSFFSTVFGSGNPAVDA